MSSQPPSPHWQPCGLPSEKSTHSFWHTEPSPLLTAHRSTRHLPSTADVVVIGSGITGASVAHHLLTTSNPSPNASEPHNGSPKRPSVVMLEAREACWGATGRNGGHCKPLLHAHPDDPSIGNFELGNFYAIQALIHSKGIDCEFVNHPGLHGVYSRSTLTDVELALDTVQSNAPDLARLQKLVTDPEELSRLRLPTVHAAVVTNIAGRIWPYKFVSRILEDLIKANDLNGSFNLQTLTPVESVTRASSGQWKVSTPRGEIVATKVVLATNAYTSHLVPSFSDLIVPCRGHMSALEPLPSLTGDRRLKHTIGFEAEGVDDYLIQRNNDSGGQLMFGGGRQCGPSLGITDDSEVDEKVANYLRTRLIDALDLPEGKHDIHASFHASHVWTGIMGYSRDTLPWVGPVPDHHDMFMSAGYTGHGMPNAWLCGLAVATMVQNSWGSQDPNAGVLEAVGVSRLPKSYLITPERFARARMLETVENQDWAEMARGRREREDKRPPSGYA